MTGHIIARIMSCIFCTGNIDNEKLCWNIKVLRPEFFTKRITDKGNMIARLHTYITSHLTIGCTQIMRSPHIKNVFMFFYWLAMVSIFILHLYCMSFLEIAILKDVYYLLLSAKKRWGNYFSYWGQP